MEDRPKNLEYFLLRTLPTVERKFSPGKVRIYSRLVGSVEWTTDDVTVSRSTGPYRELQLERSAKSDFELCRQDLNNYDYRFTRLTIERVSGDSVGTPTDSGSPASTKAKITFCLDFASDRTVECSAPMEWFARIHTVFDFNKVCRVCVVHHNKIDVTTNEGDRFCYVWTLNFFHSVTSFCPKQTIADVASSSIFSGYPAHTRMLLLLSHLTESEGFDLRVVAEEVCKDSGVQSDDDERRVDRALRYLVGQMLQTRSAIRELITDTFTEVAEELGVCHPVVEQMRTLDHQTGRLRDYESTRLLKQPVLHQLIEMDLKRVIPMRYSQIEALSRELGEDFCARLSQKFQTRILHAGLVGALPKYLPKCFHSPVPYILLKAHKIAERACSTTEAALESDLGFDPFGSNPDAANPLQEQLFKNHSLRTEGYQALRLQLMSKLVGSSARERFSKSEALAQVQDFMSKCNGYLLKQRYLVCWGYSPPPNHSWMVFFDLGLLQKWSTQPSDGDSVLSGDWMHETDLPPHLGHMRFVDMDAATVCFWDFRYASKDANIRILDYRPEFTQVQYALPQDPTSLLPAYTYLAYTHKHHFALRYSKSSNMVFMADMGSQCRPGSNRKLGARLSAFSLRSGSIPQALTIACTWFEYPSLFSECYSATRYIPDLSPLSVNINPVHLPFSPLRWCLTRRNVYCLWFVSPQTCIVYGLKEDSFVELGPKSVNKHFCTDRTYLLPTSSVDRMGGMVGLFQAQRVWDSHTKKSVVSVHQIRVSSY